MLYVYPSLPIIMLVQMMIGKVTKLICTILYFTILFFDFYTLFIYMVILWMVKKIIQSDQKPSNLIASYYYKLMTSKVLLACVSTLNLIKVLSRGQLIEVRKKRNILNVTK